ncbi:MAG: hypothetical protein E6K61_08780 [Nitrospirae bacterium]|nr:MAG: hypothetical protein E6K61_08780 [Nitrospirota bacterium]
MRASTCGLVALRTDHEALRNTLDHILLSISEVKPLLGLTASVFLLAAQLFHDDNHQWLLLPAASWQSGAVNDQRWLGVPEYASDLKSLPVLRVGPVFEELKDFGAELQEWSREQPFRSLGMTVAILSTTEE